MTSSRCPLDLIHNVKVSRLGERNCTSACSAKYTSTMTALRLAAEHQDECKREWTKIDANPASAELIAEAE